jgi:hypothetical protein
MQDGVCNSVLTFISKLKFYMNIQTGLQTQSGAGSTLNLTHVRQIFNL